METSAKIAVITGAGSGIGRATALTRYADGFSVVLAGRRRNMLEETAALGKATTPRMLVLPADVSDPAEIAALFDTVQATYGRIDLLFNNARISTRNIPIEDLTLEQWSKCRRGQRDRLVPVRATRVPHDKEPDRHAVDVSSTTGRFRRMCHGGIPRRIPPPSTRSQG